MNILIKGRRTKASDVKVSPYRTLPDQCTLDRHSFTEQIGSGHCFTVTVWKHPKIGTAYAVDSCRCTLDHLIIISVIEKRIVTITIIEKTRSPTKIK